jgi:hypothetical protein
VSVINRAQITSAYSCRPFLQGAQMPAPMEDGQYPNFFPSNNVVNAVKLEAMYQGASHVGESDSVTQGGLAQGPNGAIHFDQEFFAQTGLAFLIPDRGFEGILFSERKFSDGETH